VSGLPEIYTAGQGGLLDIAVHPDFEKNRLVYFTYSVSESGGSGTALYRARLEGMSFYTGDLFPEWKGDLFVGALAGKHLRRLELSGERVIAQEVLLSDEIGRIRDVRQGPDGHIWLLTDASNGGLYRLEP
jgi:glucose/arabinose dehydrogenase